MSLPPLPPFHTCVYGGCMSVFSAFHCCPFIIPHTVFLLPLWGCRSFTLRAIPATAHTPLPLPRGLSSNSVCHSWTGHVFLAALFSLSLGQEKEDFLGWQWTGAITARWFLGLGLCLCAPSSAMWHLCGRPPLPIHYLPHFVAAFPRLLRKAL